MPNARLGQNSGPLKPRKLTTARGQSAVQNQFTTGAGFRQSFGPSASPQPKPGTPGATTGPGAPPQTGTQPTMQPPGGLAPRGMYDSGAGAPRTTGGLIDTKHARQPVPGGQWNANPMYGMGQGGGGIAAGGLWSYQNFPQHGTVKPTGYSTNVGMKTPAEVTDIAPVGANPDRGYGFQPGLQDAMNQMANQGPSPFTSSARAGLNTGSEISSLDGAGGFGRAMEVARRQAEQYRQFAGELQPEGSNYDPNLRGKYASSSSALEAEEGPVEVDAREMTDQEVVDKNQRDAQAEWARQRETDLESGSIVANPDGTYTDPVTGREVIPRPDGPGWTYPEDEAASQQAEQEREFGGRAGFGSHAEADKAMGWPDGTAEELASQGYVLIQNEDGSIDISNGTSRLSASSPEGQEIIARANRTRDDGGEEVDPYDFPQLSDEQIQEQIDAMRSAMAFEQGKALRMQAELGSRGRMSPEAMAGGQSEMTRATGVAQSLKEADIRLKAEVMNLQQQTRAVEERIKTARLEASFAHDLRARSEAARHAMELQRHLAELQFEMQQRVDEYEKNRDFMTKVFSKIGSIVGGVAGGFGGGPMGAMQGIQMGGAAGGQWGDLLG